MDVCIHVTEEKDGEKKKRWGVWERQRGLTKINKVEELLLQQNFAARERFHPTGTELDNSREVSARPRFLSACFTNKSSPGHQVHT